MLSDTKKYLIKRNKKLLKEVRAKISEGIGAKNSLKEVAKENNVSYHLIFKMYYRREYPWSPWFEYDEEGNVIEDTEAQPT